MAATSLRTELLRLAVPLVKTHGFTREALACSALQLPEPHKEPLSEAAVTAIFGGGDDARRTLINAWMEAAVLNMRSKSSPPSLLELLESRLNWNEPVLEKLPEAFALLAAPKFSGLVLLDPSVAVRHNIHIANEACNLVGSNDIGLAWHRKRAAAAVAYASAELVQLTQPGSPDIPYKVLKQQLNRSQSALQSVEEVGLFGQYVVRSWAGIGKSLGL
ncbi:uncharacterized protein TRAVEDRAFT_169640 [Trametes versicolor FP-101664 SS1]|uniref:uncharacterized protein n=1 Tax=Trametes versicolor (strain FP-101664) TaxID=717944 RepID=UPI00046244E0|nr:uncharacterized protein TRAVEDRAFT_169640 [Trametes versicolor FP-101664 SS1]EIW57684.1 hypothetical protein TRAVEDRAFT_169640 [Trametes versicolor FP-101664 SS1]